MGAVLIYATILIGGIVEVIQYKGETFKTNEECVSYLQTYNTHINKTLQDHLDKKSGDAVVLFIGCSEKSKFATEGDLT